jgi:uracil-DNA glycosylase family 4
MTLHRGRASLAELNAKLVRCRVCPRLVAFRETVARTKRRAYADEAYWGKPVAGFGDPSARLVILGLAPGAHGANRTGRVFTGDRSGDFLYAALHRAGFANRPSSTRADDGLMLRDVYVTLAARCVPPDNHPSPSEVRACGRWLDRELALLTPRVVLALGAIAWSAFLEHLRRTRGERKAIPSPAPRFSHGAELGIEPGLDLVASYHVSQQNTQTGRLTPAMFDTVLRQCTAYLAA